MNTFLFRSLRPNEKDEDIAVHGLKPKRPINTGEDVNVALVDHVANGSSLNFQSAFISTTADYLIAVAFAGCWQRIAAIDAKKFCEQTQGVQTLVSMTTGYAISDHQDRVLSAESSLSKKKNELAAKLRFAKRSEEVLVWGDVPPSCVSVMSTIVSNARVYGAVQNFPSKILELDMAHAEQIGSANDGLLRVSSVDGKRAYILKRAKPNVKEGAMLTAEDALQNLFVEFRAFQ
jgi:hypothetical protein